MKQKALSKIEQKAIKEFKNRLIEKLGNDLVLLKLYGSKARGDWHKESDIDILVVARNKSDKIKKTIEKIRYDLWQKYNIFLSVSIFSILEFEDAQHPLTSYMYFIQKEGKNIYGKGI